MLFTLLAVAGSHPLFAQGNDVITGTITGPTGAPVNGARVTAISVETELQRSATTNAQGRFTIITDGEVLTNNSEDGAAPHAVGRQVRWDVGSGSTKIPEALIRLQ